MKERKIKTVDIVEIGGGYDGLCLFIYEISKLLNITINSYTIFDLPEACQLQQKYLSELNININTCQLDNFENIKKDSFLISNYAFSEISKEFQEEYIEKIIEPYIKFGFLAWNCIPVYDFVKNKEIEKTKEYPDDNWEYNYYVKFYPKN